MLNRRNFAIFGFFKLIFLLVLFLLPAHSEAQVYKYKDETGKWRFTDDLNQVPEQFRKPNSPAGDLSRRLPAAWNITYR